MGFSRRISRAWGAIKGLASGFYNVNQFSDSDYLSRKSGQVKISDHGLDEYHGVVPWVSICVDRKVQDIVSQPIYFVDTASGKEIDFRRVPDQIRIPFESMMGNLTIGQRLGSVYTNEELAGNGYIWLATTTAFGEIKGIADTFIPLAADKVKLNLSRNGLVLSSYRIRLDDGIEFDVPPEDIIHFRGTMIRPYIGVGAITKLRLSVQGDIAADAYYRSFLVESAKMPFQHLIVKDAAATGEDAEWERQKQMMARKYSEKMMLHGGDVDIKESSIIKQDTDFLGNRQYGRQTIISAFGMSTSVVGIPEGTNRASGEVNHLAYLSNTINNALAKKEDTWNAQFVHPRDPRVTLKYRRYAVGDVENVTKKLMAGAITPNQAAEQLGEPADYNDPERSQYYLPATLLPLSTINLPPVQASGKSFEKKKLDLTDCCNWEEISDIFEKRSDAPKKFQRKYLEAGLKSRHKIETKYIGILSDYFIGQKDRVLENVRKYGGKSIKAVADVDPNLIFELDAENEELRSTMKGMYTSGVQRSVIDINGITGASVNYNLNNPIIKSAIARLGNRITGVINGQTGEKTSISEATLGQLRDAVAKGVKEGWTINQLQDEIATKYDSWAGYRARMIARTESEAAYRAGTKVAYEEIGVKTVDIVGCTMFESWSDCGAKNVPVADIEALLFHPNHVGVPAPSEEISLAA